jgi:hydroxymethylpyrimidine/phosphomethylpyrimidine kinase
MVVIKGKFAPRAVAKQEQTVDSTEKMMEDLGLDNLVVVGGDTRNKVIACYSEFKGRQYFNLKKVWQKDGQWMHGKGLAVDPGIAKELLKNLGELSGKL